jgi:uncharacterized small protein (DUF1192 family)
MPGHSRSQNGVAALAYAGHPSQVAIGQFASLFSPHHRMDCRIKSGNDEMKIRISLPVGPGYATGARVRGRHPMPNGSSLSLPELERRIAIVRDNIRQLIEQAAANSGAGDESRNADRIAAQQEELDRLTKERDALLKK